MRFTSKGGGDCEREKPFTTETIDNLEKRSQKLSFVIRGNEFTHFFTLSLSSLFFFFVVQNEFE